MIKKLFPIILFLALIQVVTGQCQWDRFKAATDETTTSGKELGDAIDEDFSLIDVWEEMDKAGIRNIDKGLVSSWKVLSDAGVDDAIRKNVEHLEIFKNRIDEYPDVDFSKVNRVLDNQLDPDGFIKNKLGGTVKGDDHLRTLVGDFENVPGVSSKKFVDNSLPKSKVSSPTEWADSDLDLPDWAHSTFTNKATPRDLPEGTKIYRVIGDGQNPKGAFWTYDLPTNKSELYGGTAVRPEWNNGTSFVEYTVPKGGLKIWDGPTASQRVIDDVDDFMLEGGSTQIFIPDKVRADFPDLSINNMIWD